MDPQFPPLVDVLVIGGGPAGSTAAALLAEAGHKTLLVERERFPRFHVGESLMPESYWTFERLGVLDKLRDSQCPAKVGVQFVSSDGRESAPFYFRDHDDRECSQTWHVDRGEFDQMLFENAAEKGAECHDGVRVTDVTLAEQPNATSRVTLAAEGGVNPQSVEARVVVDATGQQSLIANKLGLRTINPDLKKAAIWGYFTGGERDTAGGGVKTTILQTASMKSWFWYIPLSRSTISVGVVGDRDYLLRGRGQPHQMFAEEFADCPTLERRLGQATLRPELHVAREFSYTTSRAAGHGWVLVGDAWGFIDPIYSSGVFFAVKSAEMAADSILDGLDKGDLSSSQLGRWEPEFRTATAWIRRLVMAFYSNAFRVGQFIRQHPEHRGRLTDLLIGRIFSPDVGRLFDDLDPWLAAASNHAGSRASSGPSNG